MNILEMVKLAAENDKPVSRETFHSQILANMRGNMLRGKGNRAQRIAFRKYGILINEFGRI